MRSAAFLVFVVASVAGGSIAACSPQVVDAVDGLPRDAGTGGGAGSGGNGGTGATCPGGGSDTDRDGDSTPDCLDGCPEDPDKIRPGTCGCGLEDIDQVPDGGSSCLDLANTLAHRYTFSGTGQTVVDSYGESDGVIVNAALSGAGTLDLEGGVSDQYVGLPNGIISRLGSATFEAWVRWTGGPAWQRIFDFGNSTGPEGMQGGGASYLFLTPRIPDSDLNDPNHPGPVLRVTFGRPNGRLGVDEFRLNATRALPSGTGRVTHVTVVVDRESSAFSVYIDGEIENSVPYVIDLAALTDVNNWLGRSQFATDAEFAGTLHEFRIYAAALSAEQIRISFAAGPDPVFLR